MVTPVIFLINWYLGKNYNATYLPEVAPEHFGAKEPTISSLIKKAGYEGNWKDALANITCERY